MARLALVRHGETVGNSSIRYYGRTDVELSDFGRRQMRAARRWLRHQFGAAGFAPVIASPLRRAAEGAAIIADGDRAIIKLKEFVEVDFGLFEGLTADEIRLRYPQEFERWNRNRLDPGFTYPGGESRAAFADRVERGIQRMLEVIAEAATPANQAVASAESHAASKGRVAMGGDEPALVVAHRGVIRIIVKRLIGVEPGVELGSIQVLERSALAGAWRGAAIDAAGDLEA